MSKLEKYEEDAVHKLFYYGKRLLDSGYYERALEIFTHLIEVSEKEKDNFEAQVTLETSLNNRGIANCKLGLIRKDEDLYKKGMDDFKRSISYTEKDEERIWLTAYGNLVYSEKEFEKFKETKLGSNNSFQSV